MKGVMQRIELVTSGLIDPHAARMSLDFDPVCSDDVDESRVEWEQHWQDRGLASGGADMASEGRPPG